ncbi:teicoplanin resistance protein VanJ [Actinocorallia longicatena]|uniref:Teicoplanin resistance protein VanJ n=1 Tax=Actinocorallia longicatena TaxID=111803 RepID=A0ABP6QMP6_9ACTN
MLTRRPWLAVAAVLVTAVLLGHSRLPGGVGTVVESFLPWFGLLIIPLALLRSVWALLPAVTWAAMFGAFWVGQGPGGDHDLRVVSQNVKAFNSEPLALNRKLVSLKADVVALEEITTGTRTLDRAYPHTERLGTVGVWSRYPISGVRRIDLGLGWTRALSATLTTPKGPVTIYVAHLGSARPGATRGRDTSLAHLASALHADDSRRLILLGDLNTASTDTRFTELPLDDAQSTAGWGFGFTWPSAFPVTRPDHVLYRGVTPTTASVVTTPGSDHRAVTADFRL